MVAERPPNTSALNFNPIASPPITSCVPQVDVQDLDADWIAASSHKMCGPTGAGFLYGKSDVLRSMPPWHGGGEMIDEVFFEYSTYAPPPARFEAGE